MEKKIAIVLTSLLILTLMLTTPYFTPSATAQGEPKHWKIVLAQKDCNAKIEGSLSGPDGNPIPGTSFALMCNESFVFAKVKNETANVHDINFTKWVDWDKDGSWDVVAQPVSGLLQPPVDPYDHVWYQHEQVNVDKMVVVEVHEQPYDSDRPYFEWQIMVLAQNSTYQPEPKVNLTGFLTNETQDPIPGTDFEIVVGPDYKPPEVIGVYTLHHHRTLACVVVRTEWCTVPRDINYTLQIDWTDDGSWEVNVNKREDITQFPWTNKTTGPAGKTVELEVTEVQMHRYILMEGETDAYGQLAANPPWLAEDWAVPAFDRLFGEVWKLENDTAVVNPSAPVGSNWNGTFPPEIKGEQHVLSDWTDSDSSGNLTALDWVELDNGTHKMKSVVKEVEYGAINNLTISEPLFDPITGQQLPGMGVPFATRPADLTPMTTDKFPQGTYGHNITFTQKDPITGIVKLGVPAESYVGLDHPYYSPRLYTYFRVQIYLEDQGTGWLFTGEGKDPVLGDVDIITYGNSTGTYSNRTDELMTIRPGLQGLKGNDGVPGTGDDPFGDGNPDSPGSSILLIPSRQLVLYWSAGWPVLFEAPWPQPFTSGTASSIAVEAGVGPNDKLVGANRTVNGAPMEFLAGIDHAKEGWNVTWKHPKCNAYMTSAMAWTIINTVTTLGILDVMFFSTQKAYREDCLIADINSDEKVNIKDIGRVAVAFGAVDEADYGKDGTPLTADDRITASSNFDAGADLMKPEGKINIKDIGRIAIDFGAKLTPQCIIRP